MTDLTSEPAREGANTFARPKRSFLKLPVPIDVDRLRAEYGAIPGTAWGVSYWDVHCSIDVLLLRGGDRGTEEDFGATDIHDAPILDEMPYVSSLLSPDGPLGGARYAFLFRTKPNGITRVHDDTHDHYRRATRVHVPIVTNPEAFLLSEGRSKHFSVGEMWTFDNQSQHSVVNGDSERVHMIIDVDPNPSLAALVDDAVFDPGEEDPQRWARTLDRADDDGARPNIPYDGHPLTITEKTEMDLEDRRLRDADRVARSRVHAAVGVAEVRAASG